MSESYEDMERRGAILPEGECAYCDEHRREGFRHFPPHRASAGCKSGKQPHCTCDTCW